MITILSKINYLKNLIRKKNLDAQTIFDKTTKKFNEINQIKQFENSNYSTKEKSKIKLLNQYIFFRSYYE